jgi:hypothetical protein
MCRVFFFDLKATAAALFVSCVTAAAFCAVNGSSIAKDERAVVVLVDRTLKGDRLQHVQRTNGPTASSPTRSLPGKVPLGCDRAFSPTADPAYAHVFGRCAA